MLTASLYTPGNNLLWSTAMVTCLYLAHHEPASVLITLLSVQLHDRVHCNSQHDDVTKVQYASCVMSSLLSSKPHG